MYDIGIIGGMGPKATSTLFDIIVNYTNATKDQEHPSVVILNNTKIPDRTNYIFEGGEISPLGGISEALNTLSNLVKQSGAVGMVCNTAHYFYKDLYSKTNLNFINMPEYTLKYIQNSNLAKKVCVLCTKGTKKAGIYELYNPGGIEVSYPNDRQCEELQNIIYSIKDTSNADYVALAQKLVQIMKQIGDYTFILACTELSILDKSYFSDISFVDAMDILAMLLVQKSGYKIRLVNKIYNEELITNL